jgi:light-regulated signal transduction histidine kinase (bacteriophytochrome)
MSMEWISLTDRMPNPDEHDRVLIYTQGHDFDGEQVFDVKAETLRECYYEYPADQPEVCQYATHWAARPAF